MSQASWPDLAGDLAGDLGKLDLAGDLGKLTGDLGGFGLEAFLVVLGGLDRDLGRDWRPVFLAKFISIESVFCPTRMSFSKLEIRTGKGPCPSSYMCHLLSVVG